MDQRRVTARPAEDARRAGLRENEGNEKPRPLTDTYPRKFWIHLFADAVAPFAAPCPCEKLGAAASGGNRLLRCNHDEIEQIRRAKHGN